MLVAIGGALDALLERRGGRVSSFVVSVPISGRTQAAAGTLGNQVGVMPVAVPVGGVAKARLARVAAATHVGQRQARGTSALLLAPAFRALAALHVLRWVVNRQHLVHTFATNLRGPETRVSLLGAVVHEIVSLNVLAGNVAIAFAVLSYAGTITVSATVDPSVVPELDFVVDALARQLDQLVDAG